MNNPFLKRRRKEAIKVLIAQIVILVLFVGLWELLSSLEIIDAFLFSKPSRIVKLLKTYIVTKTIYKHIGISLLETLLGLVIGTLAGLLIAIILWWNKIIAKIMEPFLVVLNALPKTALAPIIIIWMGTGIKGITAVAVSISLVLTIISAYNYFIQVEEEKIKMLQSFNATKLQILFKLVIPKNDYVVFEVGNLKQKSINHVIEFAEKVFNESWFSSDLKIYPILEKYVQNNCYVFLPIM